MRLSNCCSCFPCFGQAHSKSNSGANDPPNERTSLLLDPIQKTFTHHKKPSTHAPTQENAIVVNPIHGTGLEEQPQEPLDRRIVCAVNIADILSGAPKTAKDKLQELIVNFFQANPCVLTTVDSDGNKLQSEPFEFEAVGEPDSTKFSLSPHIGYTTKKECFSGTLTFELMEGSERGDKRPYGQVSTALNLGESEVRVFDTTYNVALCLEPVFDNLHPNGKEIAFEIAYPLEHAKTKWVFQSIVPQTPDTTKRRASAILRDGLQQTPKERKAAFEAYEYADCFNPEGYSEVGSRGASGAYAEIDPDSRPVSGRYVEVDDDQRDSGAYCDPQGEVPPSNIKTSRFSSADLSDLEDVNLQTPPEPSDDQSSASQTPSLAPSWRNKLPF